MKACMRSAQLAVRACIYPSSRSTAFTTCAHERSGSCANPCLMLSLSIRLQGTILRPQGPAAVGHCGCLCRREAGLPCGDASDPLCPQVAESDRSQDCGPGEPSPVCNLRKAAAFLLITLGRAHGTLGLVALQWIQEKSTVQ